MKEIEIKCNNCGFHWLEDVKKDYAFWYEDFTCPNCDTYNDLHKVE